MLLQYRPLEICEILCAMLIVEFEMRLRSSARTQKSYYDERARVMSFDVGQLVWLYWPRPPVRQRFRKLQRLWTGPWRIEAFKSPLVVVIKHTAKRTRQIVHVDRLLLCKTPPVDPEVDSGVPPDSQTETDGTRHPRHGNSVPSWGGPGQPVLGGH